MLVEFLIGFTKLERNNNLREYYSSLENSSHFDNSDDEKTTYLDPFCLLFTVKRFFILSLVANDFNLLFEIGVLSFLNLARKWDFISNSLGSCSNLRILLLISWILLEIEILLLKFLNLAWLVKTNLALLCFETLDRLDRVKIVYGDVDWHTVPVNKTLFTGTVSST